MKTWEELFFTSVDQEDAVVIDEKDLHELFEPIYTKLHKSYCSDNPNGALVKMTAHEMFEEIFRLIRTYALATLRA